MKSRWQTKKLREACRLINGRAYKKPELLSDGKYPVLPVGNFFTNNNWYCSDMDLDADKYCDTGDLLYAWSASFGPRIWDGGKVIYHYHIWKVEPNATVIDKRFLFLWFLWDTERIKKDQGTGTTMIHVAKGSMEDRDIPLPPLPEQRRIVGILDEAFDGIATAKANAEKNLQNARALFESHLNDVFTKRGDGWVERKLGEISQIQSGGTPLKSTKAFWDGGDIPWYTSGELNEVFTAHPKKFITESGLNHSNAKLFPKGTLLMGMYDTAALKMSILDREGTFNQAVAGMFPVPDANFFFLLYAVRHVRPQVLKLRRGVRQKNLSLAKIKAISVHIPKMVHQQEQVVKHILSTEAECERLESVYQRKLAALDELKKSLLHQAFSGQL